MLRIRLGHRRYIGDEELEDPILRRTLVGWDPTMSDDEVALAARGWWRIGERADNERYAAVVGGGIIREVMTIERWHTAQDGRRAFDGELLPPGHPVRDRLVGQPDPVASAARNPVAYIDDPVDFQPCACGCGTPVRSAWAPGHDQGALHRTLQANWGTVLDFVTWCRTYGITVPPPSEPGTPSQARTGPPPAPPLSTLPLSAKITAIDADEATPGAETP